MSCSVRIDVGLQEAGEPGTCRYADAAAVRVCRVSFAAPHVNIHVPSVVADIQAGLQALKVAVSLKTKVQVLIIVVAVDEHPLIGICSGGKEPSLSGNGNLLGNFQNAVPGAHELVNFFRSGRKSDFLEYIRAIVEKGRAKVPGKGNHTGSVIGDRLIPLESAEIILIIINAEISQVRKSKAVLVLGNVSALDHRYVRSAGACCQSSLQGLMMRSRIREHILDLDIRICLMEACLSCLEAIIAGRPSADFDGSGDVFICLSCHSSREHGSRCRKYKTSK